MEGYTGEIRMFAASFAPQNWAICAGQVLNINQNTTLFSLLGTVYGGDGSSTFALPDLQGRTIVGTGQGGGLSSYPAGLKIGTESVTLLSTQMPLHTHATSYTPSAEATAMLTIQAAATDSSEASPSGNLLGAPNAQGESIYSSDASLMTTAMAEGSITANAIDGPQLTGLTVGLTGGSLAHENRQPSVALNYIICLNGLYPSRG